jgi:transcriptional regulator with GAF, ATPase, and Fis domain
LNERAGHRSSSAPADPSGAASPAPRAAVDREAIIDALARCEGNVTRAARVLGTHRTQLRRWIKRFGIDPAQHGAPADDDEG